MISSSLDNSFQVLKQEKELQKNHEQQFLSSKRAKNIWNKADIERLYKTSLSYSMMSGRPIESLKPIDFTIISQGFNQTTSQCIRKMQEILTSGTLKPGVWGKAEDEYLQKLMEEQKLKRKEIAKALNREFHGGVNVRTWKTAKQRWDVYLNPDNNKGPSTPEEDLIIMQSYKQYGKKWSKIAPLCNQRTHGFVKNRFRSLVSGEKKEVLFDDSVDIVDRIICRLEGMCSKIEN